MRNTFVSIPIPFNKPHLTGKEEKYLKHAHSLRQLAGDGFYTHTCQKLIETMLNCHMSLLTHSCTAALEMMAILADIKPGDEVIMPSFTFVSTANAFVLRGGVPVFVDIRPDTLNINENLIEEAITKKTKAIMVVHYAGVACEMDSIQKVARKHNLLLLEDNAQGFMSKYRGKFLGTIGDMGALSFHETKNIISGEGGAVLINKNKYCRRAQIIRQKGTDRIDFTRGLVSKYTWVDIGSSFLPGEVVASFLTAQMEEAMEITKKRVTTWNYYHKVLEEMEMKGYIKRPVVPKNVEHNGHIYYILVSDKKTRNNLIHRLKSIGVMSIFHYIPLHSSPAGKKFSKFVGKLRVTNKTSNTLIRLPMYYDLSKREQDHIVENIKKFFVK